MEEGYADEYNSHAVQGFDTLTACEKLETQLCAFTGRECLDDSLRQLGLAHSIQTPKITVEQDWFRSGSETFSLYFSISDGSEKHWLVLKACVAAGSMADSVEAIAERWLQRRHYLAENGIQTPRLYAYHEALFLEEFIPFRLVDVLSANPSRELILEIVKIAASVGGLGFHPIGFFHDLLSRGEDVVVVDFGEDLGDISNCPNEQVMLSNLLKFVGTTANYLNQLTIEEIVEYFHNAMAREA